MAAKLTDEQRRRRDALRIESIIESAERRIDSIFYASSYLWHVRRRKRGELVAYYPNPLANTIIRPLEQAYDAAAKIAESCGK